MNNTNTKDKSSLTTLIIGVIVGVLVISGIYSYMQRNNQSTGQGNLEADITVPIRNDGVQTQ